MANNFNLTLDTTAPSGITVKINGDAERTSSTAATLAITCSDADTTGYQMKVWGDIVNPDNPTALSTSLTCENAAWETFATSKNVVLTTGDGTKTVYVLVRDDVYNCNELGSVTQNDSIILATRVPVVSITGPDRAKISKISGKSLCKFTFSVDESIDEVKVVLVSSANALATDASNIDIVSALTSSSDPDLNISDIFVGNYGDESLIIDPNHSVLHGQGFGTYDANTVINVQISGQDMKKTIDDDGLYIVKVFAKSSVSGNWSI